MKTKISQLTQPETLSSTDLFPVESTATGLPVKVPLSMLQAAMGGLSSGPNWRFDQSTGEFQIKNHTTGKYSTVWLVGEDGQEQPAFVSGQS